MEARKTPLAFVSSQVTSAGEGRQSLFSRTKNIPVHVSKIFLYLASSNSVPGTILLLKTYATRLGGMGEMSRMGE
jgi:hypothetical protein